MRDRIEIEKDNIPYSFDILLGDESFELEISYNEKADLFTVTLSKEEEVLVYDEPVIYGVPLFQDCYNTGFPALSIVPLDESGENDAVTWGNFGETVFLTMDEEGDEL